MARNRLSPRGLKRKDPVEVYIVVVGKHTVEVYENYESAVEALNMYEDQGLSPRLFEREVVTD